MYEPRHPLKPALSAEALRAAAEAEAYFTADKAPVPAKPAANLSPLEQMFAYYDA